MRLRTIYLLLLAGLTLQAMEQKKAKRRRSAATYKNPQELGLALIEAAQSGDENTVKALIKALTEKGADLNFNATYSQEPALIWATRKSRPKIVSLLLEAGADPNIEGKARRTPLMWAATTEVAEELLKYKADPNKQDMFGETALMAAAWRNTPALAPLLAAGANPNTKSWQDTGGWTALMIAATCGQTDMVRVLINAGAGLELEETLGRRALELAMERDRSAVVKLLIGAGADTTRINFDNEIRKASDYGNLEMLKVLTGIKE